MLYRDLLRPLLFRLPAESAHELALHTIAMTPPGLIGTSLKKNAHFEPGPIRAFGLDFQNPVGLAAGFDKNAVAASQLAGLGFSFIEVGTVTSIAQPGNPRPRLFRLPLDRALINRAGFNNEGAKAVCARLRRRRPDCILGINIGKSRVVPVEQAVDDYLASFELAHPIADYIAINVSSPNTPNLRELQKPEALRALLVALQQRNTALSTTQGRPRRPILLKIAPDLKTDELAGIAEIALSTNIDALIATNTTVSRGGLRTDAASIDAIGQGGLSGAPLKEQSTRVISELYRLLGRQLPIIGVGGIFTAQDAWDKILAGATLVQVYTGFIYEGPMIVKRINAGLERLMMKAGFTNYDDAVGAFASRN